MPVRHGIDGKLEYYREKIAIAEKMIDWLKSDEKPLNMWPDNGKGKKKKRKPYKGYHYEDHEGSCSSSSSCSPKDCPTCTNKNCPNSYDDFLEKDDMKL